MVVALLRDRKMRPPTRPRVAPVRCRETPLFEASLMPGMDYRGKIPADQDKKQKAFEGTSFAAVARGREDGFQIRHALDSRFRKNDEFVKSINVRYLVITTKIGFDLSFPRRRESSSDHDGI